MNPGSTAGQCLGEQVREQQYLDAPGPEQRGESVVLLLRAGHPGQSVEEQRIVVAGGEPLQFDTGPVQDDRPQAADLGVDAEPGCGHG